MKIKEKKVRNLILFILFKQIRAFKYLIHITLISLHLSPFPTNLERNVGFGKSNLFYFLFSPPPSIETKGKV